MEFLHGMSGWIASFAESPFGWLILFVMAFAESSFFPLPPDILLIPLALTNPALALVYSAICTAGSVFGGMFGFRIGDWGGKKILNKLVSKEKIEMVKHYYHKYDVWAVGMAAFTPIPYKVFTISAGTFNLNFKRFVVASILGRGSRFFLIGILIFVFGPAIRDFLNSYFELVIIAFTVLLIGGFLAINFMLKRYAKKIKKTAFEIEEKGEKLLKK